MDTFNFIRKNFIWKQSVVVIIFTLSVLCPVVYAEEDPEVGDISYDGLTIVHIERGMEVQVKDDVDWTLYSNLMLLETQVSFKENWRRDFNRSTSFGNAVSENDVLRMKRQLGELVDESFQEAVTDAGNFELVTEAQSNTLLVRAAVINLDVYAPDTRSAGRNSTYVRSAGSAILYLEAFDAISGEILLRWVDYEQDPSDFVQWASRGSNTQAARRIIDRWVSTLQEGFADIRDQ